MTSRDGRIRGASLETVTKDERRVTLRRPVNKLVMVERGDEQDHVAHIKFMDDKDVSKITLVDQKSTGGVC